LIKIRNLTFYYADATKPALRDINLDIKGGEFLLITGPSGSGKTSLCRCFNGLIPHFHGGRISGQVEVDGITVAEHPTKGLATKIGMVFQDPENQLVAIDVEREIAFGLENLAFPRDVIAKRLEESLDTLGISNLRYRQVHELSGGEKQKVAIASVLALHPDILVLDEPTSELDPHSAEEVLSIVQRLNDELGLTVVLLEHRLDRVVHLIDRMIVMDGGYILADGNPREILDDVAILETGVGAPPIVRLVQRLKQNGASIDRVPLTVKEGRSILDEAFQKNGEGESSTELPAEKSEGEPIIKMDKLWHSYPQGPTSLRGVNLDIRKGEFVSIMGRNASGKTTLVKHLNGLLKPTKGKVTVDGTDTRDASVAQLARKVGMVFQNPNDHIFADTVEDEIAFILKNLGFEGCEVGSRVDDMLEIFNLAEYRKRYPRLLSGGQRQRVALASVLVARPGVLILDEPTRGLEYRLKSELMGFIERYRSEGNTVILVTHDVEIVAEYADRVVLLSEGRVVVDGNKHDVLSQALLFSPQINRLVQAFARYGVPGNILTVEEALRTLE
jgi:energy-coupling factor transporter ATP-binding protein EcfA2